MVNIVIELSKYLMIFMIVIYTFECFTVFNFSDEQTKRGILRRQNVLMFMMHFMAFLAMFLKTEEKKMIEFYGMQVVLFLAIILLYTKIYPRVSRLVVNNMCMLLAIGFIMITRLSYTLAVKQFVIAVGSLALSLVVPVFIRKVKALSEWKKFYAIAGVIMLVFVIIVGMVLGRKTGGAMLNVKIAGFTLQPSELVKIIFVFYVAASFQKDTSFKNVVITTCVAAMHVLILVASKDLGAALIVFAVYLTMLYVASRQPLYVLAGVGAGSVAAVGAYYLFSHVRVRVLVWKDPFAVFHEGGQQVAQALMAIGTGSRFGMGLMQGAADTIFVGESDFIFAGISEEMGLIFALCLTLICVSVYVMFLNIAMQLRNQFYKLVALGLGTCYIFQVFLNIGGVTKFIPSTGVTLPLVSYGGSSVLSTIIMFAIIQGLYILREDEEEDIERKKAQQLRIRQAGSGSGASEPSGRRRAGAAQKKNRLVGASGTGTQKRRTGKKPQSTVKAAEIRSSKAGEAVRREEHGRKREEDRKEKRVSRKRRNVNKEFARVTYIFVTLFLVMIGYMVYFNVIRSKEVINSPYNVRQDLLADRVIRGKIVDRKGEVLAQTVTDEAGNEVREYPYADVFTHVVGYASKGKYGLESVQNFHLLTSNAFFLEKLAKEFRGEKNMGDTVVSTLDADIQQAAYNALGNNKGAVVVMEASTGKILAMVSKPTFDPNYVVENWEILNNDSGSSLMNRATLGQYTPGSTFKLVTTPEYMREHPDYESYQHICEGAFSEGGATIHCYNNTVHGQENLADSVANSCNTSFSNIGLGLDKTKWKETTKNLLFDGKLPSDLPYKSSHFSLKKEDNSAKTMMTAIGQGDTLVSPYHMALITAAIANGGTLMKPYLVDQITNYKGAVVKKYMPEKYTDLMTSGEAAKLTEYMEDVVNYGTGTALSGESYTVAGKTGTAEVSVDKSVVHSWFVGFSNVENPELVVSVVVENADTANITGVRVAKEIFNAYYD